MTFYHGAEIQVDDSGPRSIAIEGSEVVGLVGTAPDAEAAVAAKLAYSAGANTGLVFTAETAGLAGNAIRIFAQAPQAANQALAVSVATDRNGALVTISLETETTPGVSVSTAAEVLAAVNGHAGAALLVGVALAAGSTGAGVVAKWPKQLALSGGRDAALPLNTPTLFYRPADAARLGLAGTIPEALDGIWDQGRGWVCVVRVAPGSDDAATLSNMVGSGADGTGVHALLAARSVLGLTPRILIATGFTDQLALATEMSGLAERLRGVVVGDCPGTTDAEAIGYRGNFGSSRMYLVAPRVKFWDRSVNAESTQPASARVAGLIQRVDAQRGFHESPSNHEIYGITGTSRPIDFAMGDASSAANYLNANEVATIIRQDGFRLWGNRTCSSDPRYAFLSVRRIADAVDESILQGHLWAIDRGITSRYAESVLSGVRRFLGRMEVRGAIPPGWSAWFDGELNTPDAISSGQVFFNYAFAGVAPAERLTFRRQLLSGYIVEVTS